ncbi:phosphatase PAP2 family protein [Streptomyces lacrimifluminis]|uniref:Phosphatase PAP2 family protein n=1 Tax=Streptomyces lacrimifluminis TaxID=1500077 RepID=A0A917NKH2_9ACTN|nr:phosphatase PAP2 family protein [Streptomyces lacrimifluminis]GGJ07407.1 phosphatase PAP2 family protein [Streptomyces lacrimifluminis]
MAGFAETGSNPDVDLLYDINGLAKDAPRWFDRVVEVVGEYGLLIAMVLVVVWCWWSVRRRGGDEAAVSVAALIWAPLAAGVAVLVNIPIRGFVERPRPFLDHQGLEVLVSGKTDYSFVSDHATITMAMGVGLFVANRKFGLVGIGLALVEGFCRVYMGVHYPTDVVGGFALGTAVVLLLSPLAMALLTPVARAVEGSGWGRVLIRARGAGSGAGSGAAVVPGARAGAGADADAGERDLAA